MHTCCRIRTGNKSVLRLLIHAEGSTFDAVLETTENVITAATAGVSSKLKYGSRPLQNNWVQQLFSARKQNYNLQPHPALVFIHWTLLTLGKPSAEARKSYRVGRTLPFHSPSLFILHSLVSKAEGFRSEEMRTGVHTKLQMMWFSVNISILIGPFWCIITAAVEYNKLCLIWNMFSIYWVRKNINLN